ncbi:MAG: hypothetical protein MK180_07705 [Rhodobacteraceae bacterium]|nr:hypothetical protein [Paracoccaceae bacterium]
MNFAFAWWVWAAFGLVLGILEIVLPVGVLLGFAIGAGVVALLLALGGAAFVGGTVPWMIVIFAATSLVAWLVLRYVFRLRVGQQVKVWETDIND